MMNLPIFLKEVDILTSKLSHGDLENFIREIARTLPEGKRDYFLHTLKAFSPQEEMPQEIVKDDGYDALQRELETIKEKLAEIDEMERRLDSEYNEEWDDWYNSDVDEILFKDPEGVIDDIDRAVELLHRCFDMEAYQEGY